MNLVEQEIFIDHQASLFNDTDSICEKSYHFHEMCIYIMKNDTFQYRKDSLFINKIMVLIVSFYDQIYKAWLPFNNLIGKDHKIFKDYLKMNMQGH